MVLEPAIFLQAFLLGSLGQAGCQDLHGHCPVLELGPLVLDSDLDARRQVRDAHGRIRHVDVLAAGPL